MELKGIKRSQNTKNFRNLFIKKDKARKGKIRIRKDKDKER